MNPEELKTLKKIDLLKYLKPADLFQFLSLLDLNVRNYSEGEVIIEKDTIGNTFYVVQEGEVGGYLQDPDSQEKPNFKLSEGDFFGDLAAFYGFPRTAYIVAEEDTEVWELDGNKIRAIMDIHKDKIGYQIQRVLEEKLADRLKASNLREKRLEEEKDVLERKLLQYEQ